MGPLDKQPEEDEEVYYKRIFKRKPDEKDSDFESRVTVIKKYKPDLEVWQNDVYKTYVSKVEVNEEQPKEKVTETTTTTVTRSVTQPETSETTEVCSYFYNHISLLSHLIVCVQELLFINFYAMLHTVKHLFNLLQYESTYFLLLYTDR